MSSEASGGSAAPTSPAPTRRGPRPGPRVRPVTWVILSGMLIAIAAVLGAWQGSASRMGAIPEITVATDSGHTELPPFRAADLAGTRVENPPATVHARADQTLTVRLPVELQRTSLVVYTERGATTEETPVAAGTVHALRIAVTTPVGRLTHVAVRGLPSVYDSAGEESILSGEWAFSVTVP